MGMTWPLGTNIRESCALIIILDSTQKLTAVSKVSRSVAQSSKGPKRTAASVILIPQPAESG